MLLGIALDGADSPAGGCTTHLASLLILKWCSEGKSLADYPWLVRLNPSIPHKTRGNGAIVIWLHVDTLREAQRVYNEARDIALQYARATGSNKLSIAAILVEQEDMPPHTPLSALYTVAVTSYTPLKVAERYLKLVTRQEYIRFIEAQGVYVGTLAALGARLEQDHTFEALFYMPPNLWGARPAIPSELVAKIAYTLGPYDIATFDFETGKPLIQPHGPDPVLAGVRSDDPLLLRKAAKLVPENLYTHFVIYRSNQHTDAHLTPRTVTELRPYTCGIVEGYLVEARWISGGHVIARLCDDTGCIDVAFYRETMKLRKIAIELVGEHVTISGCVRPHSERLTLNAERIIHDTLVYEPPASTWHHLYMPLARYHRVTRPRGLTPERNCDSIIITA